MMTDPRDHDYDNDEDEDDDDRPKIEDMIPRETDDDNNDSEDEDAGAGGFRLTRETAGFVAATAAVAGTAAKDAMDVVAALLSVSFADQHPDPCIVEACDSGLCDPGEDGNLLASCLRLFSKNFLENFRKVPIDTPSHPGLPWIAEFVCAMHSLVCQSPHMSWNWDEEEEWDQGHDSDSDVLQTYSALKIIEEAIFHRLYEDVFGWYKTKHFYEEAHFGVRRDDLRNTITLEDLKLEEFFLLNDYQGQGHPYSGVVEVFDTLQCQPTIHGEVRYQSPSQSLRTMQQVIKCISSTVSDHWTSLLRREEAMETSVSMTELRHPASLGGNPVTKYQCLVNHPAALTKMPKSRRNLSTDDLLSILSWTVTQSNQNLQGLVALTYFLKDYLAVSQQVAQDAGCISARNYFNNISSGSAGFSLESVQGAMSYIGKKYTG